MDNIYPKRKHTRLKNYDYTQSGCYFLTICTKDKQHLLGKIVSEDVVANANIKIATVQLSDYGKLVKDVIDKIETHYHATVENYVIMPNHVHLLLTLESAAEYVVSVPKIIATLKNIVTRKIGENIWQTSYHDHIIRDEADMIKRWSYIDSNPAKWAEDKYFISQTDN
jgi:REP element-mobilizing transposase RayT